MTSTRSDQYRQFHLGAEHSSGKIERAYVAQDTRPKGPGGKCAAISIDAELVRGAAGDIVILRFGQAFLRKLFEVK